MGGNSFRVTDQHVRRNDDLVKLACEYAEAYDGDFEVLVNAKHILDQHNGLTVPQARTVLNCLRQEMDGYWLPFQLRLDALLRPMEVEHPTPPAPRLRVVRDAPKKERLWEVRVPARLKVEYCTPKPRNGAIHVAVDAEVWWRDTWVHGRRGRSSFKPRQPILVVWTECGNSYYNPLLTGDDETWPERNYCKSGCWED